MAQLKKHASKKGTKGKHVIFSPNITFDETTGILTIPTFRLYTPIEGLPQDENGHTYYQVPPDTVLIQRNAKYNREIYIFAEVGKEIQVYPVFLHKKAGRLTKSVGLEGCLIAKVIIPKDPQVDIIIDYWEITDG